MNAAIIKDHFRRFTCPHSQLVFLLASSKTRRSSFHDKCSCISAFPWFAGATYYNGNVSTFPMCDPVLGASEHPLVSFSNSGAFHVSSITAGVWLRQSPGSYPFCRSKLRQVFSFLLFVRK